MIEALVALLVATLLVLVFKTGFVAIMATIGGVGFFIYVIILIIKWLIGRA